MYMYVCAHVVLYAYSTVHMYPQSSCGIVCKYKYAWNIADDHYDESDDDDDCDDGDHDGDGDHSADVNKININPVFDTSNLQHIPVHMKWKPKTYQCFQTINNITLGIACFSGGVCVYMLNNNNIIT